MTVIPAFAQPFIVALMGLGLAAHRSPQPPDAVPVLTISGKATARVTPATFYAFTPTVYQSGDGVLRFGIQNKPSWASLGSRRGTLYGVPQARDAGTYSNIIITVSDGKSTAQLPAFSINVTAPPSTAPK